MRIGKEQFIIESEIKQSIDTEILLLNLLVYVVVLIYAFGYLNWPTFYLLFHLVYMRVFMGNHDRMHANMSSHLPKPLEFLSENLAIVVTPWDEPYDSIKKKHLTHHKTHLSSKEPIRDLLKDPQSVYEVGGFFKAFISCVFYEEIQLVSDIRNKNISKSRWIRLIIYLPLQLLFLTTFGWGKYLGVFFAVRLLSSMAWFFFSWFLHKTFYTFGMVDRLPKSFIFIFGLLNGRRVKDGSFRHVAHHAWPYIPSGKLFLLDDAIKRNTDTLPKMLRTRN